MEVADEIVVINDGVIEQVGTPDDLYERPANDFVMRFLGPVTSVGGLLVRPHDIDVLPEAEPASVAARVERLVRLGFEVRVDAVDSDGRQVSIQLTKNQAAGLGLEPGKEINLRVGAALASNGEPTPIERNPATAPDQDAEGVGTSA